MATRQRWPMKMENAAATEAARLSTVTDPSGRTLKFYWHDFVPSPGVGQDHTYRIVQVDGPQYSVVYRLLHGQCQRTLILSAILKA